MPERALDIQNPYPDRVECWYKGNTHAHPSEDKRHSVQEFCEAYENLGYDFLAITDHDAVTCDFGYKGGLVLVPGVEISCRQEVEGSEEKGHHLIALDFNDDVPTGKPLQETIDIVREAGALPILSHPLWSRMSFDSFVGTKNLVAVEVFNAACRACHGNGDSTPYWARQIILYRDPQLWGVASDDAHSASEIGQGWIMVAAEELSREAIVDAIRKGTFYASTGPQFNRIRVTEDHRLEAWFSSVQEVRVIAGVGSRIRVDHGHHLVRAEYRIEGNEGAVRIEIEDAGGRMAWTNPITVY